MGAHRRKRRPGEGEFQASDARAWRRLVAAAEAQARAPLALPDDLIKAGDKVVKAVIPLGWRHRGSAFLALAAIARGWFRLNHEERAAKAEELAGLAHTCAAAIDAAEAGPERPPRADVFG